MCTSTVSLYHHDNPAIPRHVVHELVCICPNSRSPFACHSCSSSAIKQRKKTPEILLQPNSDHMKHLRRVVLLFEFDSTKHADACVFRRNQGLLCEDTAIWTVTKNGRDDCPVCEENARIVTNDKDGMNAKCETRIYCRSRSDQCLSLMTSSLKLDPTRTPND
jgi:hypothetical protein